MNEPATGGAAELRPLPVLSASERLELLEIAVQQTWDSLGVPLTDAAEEAFHASVDVRFVLAELCERRNREWAQRLGEAIARDIVLGAEWLPDVVFQRATPRGDR